MSVVKYRADLAAIFAIDISAAFIAEKPGWWASHVSINNRKEITLLFAKKKLSYKSKYKEKMATVVPINTMDEWRKKAARVCNRAKSVWGRVCECEFQWVIFATCV
ncbi:hypothetical protein B4900_16115 [Yersinia rohdei]|nr:hypothetical protein B4900_16115 [Yersinia rohdei]